MARASRIPGRVGTAIAALAAAVAALFPLYYMALTSVKTDELLLSQPPRFWFVPDFANYRKLLIGGDFPGYYWNSINVAVWSTVLAVGIGSMMAFAFAHVRFRGARALFLAVLIPRSFPPIATLIPIYFAVRALGLMDQVGTLVVLETAVRVPLVVWIMRGFLRALPGELVEAALLDGCSVAQSFFRIVVPLAGPGLAAAAIVSFIDTWNSFLVPLVLTNLQAVTAPVGLMSYAEPDEQLVWGVIAAGGVLTVLPVLAFGVLMNRYLLGGLTTGALK